MQNKHWSKDTIFYFLGIGGIGMSALARFFHAKGHIVLGYDKTSTPLTQQLEQEGIDVTYEDDLLHLPSLIRLTPVEKIWVCYTPAIPQDSLLKQYFLHNEFPMMKRSVLLGKITEQYHTIAVAGTHGKTTTSSMIAYLLTEVGFKVNAFLGGISANFQSNLVLADSDWVVVEADEFDRSFLTLTPEWAVVTAVDPDHLDIYGDAETFEKGFQDFSKKIKPNGHLLVQHGVSTEFNEMAAHTETIRYGITDEETVGCRAENIAIVEGNFVFDYKGKIDIDGIVCGLSGRHNVENAVAAITIAFACGGNPDSIKRAMATFKGVGRRFERVLDENGVVMIDDYAHHPTELNAAIASARMLFPGKKIGGVFQPHLFSRTRDFLPGFVSALSTLDGLILLPIYPARELPIPGIDSQLILDKISLLDKKLLEKSELLEIGIPADWEVVLVLGAGDIDHLVQPLAAQIKQKKN
jgi:UDP-N-acetylmuramate--alanine ligase